MFMITPLILRYRAIHSEKAPKSPNILPMKTQLDNIVPLEKYFTWCQVAR
jgi:hypothetical protein